MTGYRNSNELRSKLTDKQRQDSDRKLARLKSEMVLTELCKHSDTTDESPARTIDEGKPTPSDQDDSPPK